MIDGSATVCGPQPAGIKNDTVTLEKTAPGQSRQGVSANVTSSALAFPLLVLEELGLALVFLGCRACLGCLLLVVSLVLLRLALYAEVIATGDAPERLFSGPGQVASCSKWWLIDDARSRQMFLITWMVLSGPRAGSKAAASEAKAAAALSDLVQKSETLVAVAATSAAWVNELACAPISEHSWRKVSIAVAAAAAEVRRHLAMIAWISGRLLPCDALATAVVMQVCSEPLISASFARSCSTVPASSGGRDNIERGSFRHNITGPMALPERNRGLRPLEAPGECDPDQDQTPDTDRPGSGELSSHSGNDT
ncbi:MAG: hypothetical protein DLM61_28250 [Pseudonocardiales bacterium]|nr:MAG: hypothetical protein DLM61_28250 [Pseudonocardiales bacterium]